MAAVGQERVRTDANLPLVEAVQPVDAAQQRRLARAAGTDQGHGLPGVDRQGDVVQHAARAELLRKVGDFDLHVTLQIQRGGLRRET